jgi:hypothetical protein
VDIDLSSARAALAERRLAGFVDVVAAEGIVERCAARAATAKIGNVKPPPPPPPPIIPD